MHKVIGIELTKAYLVKKKNNYNNYKIKISDYTRIYPNIDHWKLIQIDPTKLLGRLFKVEV